MTSDEKWLPVVGFEGYYQVSDLGRVYSIRTKRIMRQSIVANRYPGVRLKVDGAGKTLRTHVLVALAFIGPRPDMGGVRVDVCHNDGDPLNPALSNLRYDTHRNNQRQMTTDGTSNASRTHCKRGHEFTPDNTWHHSAKNRALRTCRACHYLRKEERRAANSGDPQSA